MNWNSDAWAYIFVIVMVIATLFAVLYHHFQWLVVVSTVGSFGSAIYNVGRIRGWWK